MFIARKSLSTRVLPMSSVSVSVTVPGDVVVASSFVVRYPADLSRCSQLRWHVHSSFHHHRGFVVLSHTDDRTIICSLDDASM